MANSQDQTLSPEWTRHMTCPLCEAMCGLTIKLKGDHIVEIGPDHQDVLSHGFLCPKAFALKPLHEDSQRLRRPLRKNNGRWEEIGWEAAFAEAADKLAAIQKRYGADSVAFYSGNPNVHSYAAQILEMDFVRCLGSKNRFSTASMDHLPHLFAAYHLFGHQVLIPVPDVDRTDYLLILGANPAVSNGSLIAAPGMLGRLKKIQNRGGRVVVIDPRRTQTAAVASNHYFIRPGTDALLLLAMIQVISQERLIAPAQLKTFIDGTETICRLAQSYPPERVADHVGIAADVIRQLAVEYATAPSAACYGRMGTCTQEFGALTCWLTLVLNILTGNLDRPGGMMFSKPAVDIVRVAGWLGQQGSFGRWRSRVRGLREFGGFLPVAAMAEEIDTPGPGQVRAIITSAGNPVLSTPNGPRLDRALATVEFMVAIDFYVNETTRHADLILPPTSPFERDHYDIALRAFGARNTTRYTKPLIEPGADARQDWEIYAELGRRMAIKRGGLSGYLAGLRMRVNQILTPRRILSLLLRAGPYGRGFVPWRTGLSMSDLLAEDHTVDLGPLGSCLPERLYTQRKRIQLAPQVYLDDLVRLESSLAAPAANSPNQLLLIGRRQLRSNNSWMHHVERLATASNRCTALIHPLDAEARGISDGQLIQITSRVGKVVAPAEISASMMRGVISLPHGFGHNKPGTRVHIPDEFQGVSVNDLTDERHLDVLSGTVSFNGLSVVVRPYAELEMEESETQITTGDSVEALSSSRKLLKPTPTSR